MEGDGCGALGTLESPTFAVRSLNLATNEIESGTPNGYPGSSVTSITSDGSAPP